MRAILYSLCLVLPGTAAWAQDLPPEHNDQQAESRFEDLLQKVRKEQNELNRLLNIVGQLPAPPTAEASGPTSGLEDPTVSLTPPPAPANPAAVFAVQTPAISPPPLQTATSAKAPATTAPPIPVTLQPQTQAAPPSRNVGIPDPPETVQPQPPGQTSANASSPELSDPSASEPVQPQRSEPTSPDRARPQPNSPSAAEIREMLTHGQSLFASGDIAGARLLFTRAASGNDPEALTALARTYDPDVLRKVRVLGIRPDKAKAEALYHQAERAHAGR